MNFTLKLNGITTLDSIPGYWTDDDFIHILEDLEVSDAQSASPAELGELIKMALADFEPSEAAEILVKTKLSEKLNPGQIQNLSHEMVDDDESAGNANIALHYDLFNITQLLSTAFPGMFPTAKATRLDFELRWKDGSKEILSKELALKALSRGLTGTSPILRLFKDQLDGKEPFADAEHLVWELHDSGSNQYALITSDYWISEEDFTEREFSNTLHFYDEDED
ncbi:MAG: hypothetical protein WD708_03870 [Kiritimatiellia bacterium]